MPWDPNTDAGYQSYLQKRVTMSGPERAEFDETIIHWLFSQIAASATLNGGTTNAATVIAAALANKRGGKRSF